jgi:SAM-dependent methyltransferase
VSLLRTALGRAGFTAAAVGGLLGSGDALGRDSAELPLYQRQLPAAEPLATLVRLFVLGVPVAAGEAAFALAPLPLERAVSLGALHALGDGVAPAIELVPADDLIIAADPFRDELSHRDHVPGLSPPARVLAHLTVREPIENALDLGTGQGLHALLAAAHAGRVTAVDTNPRALRYAAFNLLLNDRGAVELLRGDRFEPVAGRAFDLVVCNPPYVISPEAQLAYRDSGLRGDAFCESLVRAIPGHLHEGGLAHVLVSWTHGADEEWSSPLRRWLEGSGCDALLLRLAVHDPLTYASGWNRALRSDPDAYGDALDRWTAYCHELGIEAISWGAVVMRRRTGRNWVFAHTHAADRFSPAGHHIARLIAGQDLLAALRDERALLDARPRLAADHRLEQAGAIQPDGLAVERAVLRLDGGLALRVSVDAATIGVLALLDGHRTVREALAAAVAGEARHPDLAGFTSAALPVVRRLVELGFLVVDERVASSRLE